MINALLVTAVDARAMLPVALVVQFPVGINVICPPADDIGLGAVMLVIKVVPDTNVIDFVGAMVEALAMVGALAAPAIRPPITVLPPMPTPPATCSAPVVVDTAEFVPLMRNCSVTVPVPLIVVLIKFAIVVYLPLIYNH
jgi:hypothetical protein